MENQNDNLNPLGNSIYPQHDLPNAKLVLVLGILSIVFGCCFAPVGLVLSIIALVNSSKDKRRYEENPDIYSQSSISNINTGKICAIIGLVIALAYIVYIIFIFATSGTLIWQEYMKMMEEMKNKDSDFSMIQYTQTLFA